MYFSKERSTPIQVDQHPTLNKWNKRCKRKPKGQSKVDNPETLVTSGEQDED